MLQEGEETARNTQTMSEFGKDLLDKVASSLTLLSKGRQHILQRIALA